MEWLIAGHLTQNEALTIIQQSQYSLTYTPLDSSQIHLSRLVQLPAHSVHDYELLNSDPANPNSAVLSIFQMPRLRTYPDEAVLSVLFHLLREPFFNQLRTKEQLGYIVSCNTNMVRKVLHGRFIVQSNVMGPDGLI